MKRILLFVVLVVLGVIFFVYKNEAKAPIQTAFPSSAINLTNTIFSSSRITKKFFGTYVTPQNSPVQPEKFTGYHTGVDFETTAAEANVGVPVPAFCDGNLVMKKYATGYGGVAVESCTLAGQTVTVIYGHLNVASIKPAVGQALKKGDFIGNLGKGYSTETDGERKHLHLGIHKGTTINILGYLQKQSDLSGWLDPMQFLK